MIRGISMIKATVIGHMDWKSNNMIGAVVKARNILNQLSMSFPYETISNIDIYNWRKRAPIVLAQIIRSFAQSKNIILIISDTSGPLMKLLAFLNAVFKRKILYVAVGGNMGYNLMQNKEAVQSLSFVDSFFVENIDCVQDMKALGLKNTFILRNFKLLSPMSEVDISDTLSRPFKFCTFSRVAKQKGITDAINAIEEINTELGEGLCELDVYGKVEYDYEQEFYSLVNSKRHCNYCGVVDGGDSVKILKDYYCLLFPTKFQTEGIPGTIIDAFAAALPVICSDWQRCRQLIIDGKNGIVYKFADYSELKKSIIYAINNPERIKKLKSGCLKAYQDYLPDKAIKPLLERLS